MNSEVHTAADTDLGSVLRSVPDGVLLVGAELDVVWANPAAEQLFGITLAEGIGRSGLEFIHPDDLGLVAASMMSVQSKERGTPIEVRINTSEGWRLVEVVGAPFGDQLLISIRDLTERRRWEIAGDEVARFRSLMQNAASVTMLLNGDGIVQDTSGGVTRLLGWDQEWVEKRSLSELVDEADRTVLEEGLELLRGLGPSGPVTLDLRMRTLAGGTVSFALTFTNMLDDPTVEGIVVTGHDVSDRVVAQEQLEAAHSLLAATLESTFDGILVVDLDGEIRSYNRRFASMWRFSENTLTSMKDSVALARALEQVKDPAGFLAKVEELYARPDAESNDVIELIDGRVFERDSLPQRIGGEVVGRVWSFRDVTEQSRLQRELTHQAFHDPLTGLANTALFRNRVDHAATRIHRTGQRHAVLFIDLDDFKTINDSLGHSAGDDLLKIVSQSLLRSLRSVDTAARLGGDEFAVLIDDVEELDDVLIVAERILAAVREPIHLAQKKMATSVSIGIAIGDGTHDAEALLRNADLAMYAAKSAGKNCVKVFADEMHQAALDSLDLDMRLRGVVERDELVVHYQPIQDMGTGRIVAMEALVRWNHPERGLLGPGSFIEFAEQHGHIDAIGYHVLVTACEQACRWAREVGIDAPAVSVNLSPHQLLDPTFTDRVELLLHRTGLHPAQLILEITEGVLMSDPAAAIVSLERLSGLGVRLAVDDFGTGYSSLAYLQQFPVNILKIDGSFVSGSANSDDWSLARAVVQIAHAIGLVALAEGVETQEQADALSAFGCDLAQGYHLARPAESEAAMELIRSSLGMESHGSRAEAAG